MGVDWSTNLQLPLQDLYSRPVTVTPVASQPGGAAYAARGIFDTDGMDYPGLDGSIISNSRTILDIRTYEFPVWPIQHDIIDIPPDPDTVIEGGLFEVIDVNGFADGGGELTLVLRRIMSDRLCYMIVDDYFVGEPTFDSPALGIVSDYSVEEPTFDSPALTVT
jgi:hypothetical protein